MAKLCALFKCVVAALILSMASPSKMGVFASTAASYSASNFATVNPQVYGMAVNGTQLLLGSTSNNMISAIPVAGGSSSWIVGGASGTDDGPVADAKLRRPRGMVMRGSAVVWVEERKNIRTLDNGVVSTLFSDDDYDFRAITISSDRSVAFVTDKKQDGVYRFDFSDNSLTEIAAPGGSAASAVDNFNDPEGIAFATAAETALIVCDTENRRITQVDIATGTRTLFVGTGEDQRADGPNLSAKTKEPMGIVADFAHSIFYFVEQDEHCVRKIEGGYTTTILTSANSIDAPVSLLLTNAGDTLFVGQRNDRLVKVAISLPTTAVPETTTTTTTGVPVVVTDEPSTQEPSTSTEAPVTTTTTSAPTTEAPETTTTTSSPPSTTTESPSTGTPSTETPSTETPSTETPSTTTGSPSTESPRSTTTTAAPSTSTTTAAPVTTTTTTEAPVVVTTTTTTTTEVPPTPQPTTTEAPKTPITATPRTLEPAPVPGAPKRPVYSMGLTLALSVERVRENLGELKNKLAEGCNVGPEFVTITAVYAGSTVVEFEVETTQSDEEVQGSMQSSMQTGGALKSFQPIIESFTMKKKSGAALYEMGVAFYFVLAVCVCVVVGSLGWAIYRGKNPERPMKTVPTAAMRDGRVEIGVTHDDDVEGADTEQLFSVGPTGPADHSDIVFQPTSGKLKFRAVDYSLANDRHAGITIKYIKEDKPSKAADTEAEEGDGVTAEGGLEQRRRDSRLKLGVSREGSSRPTSPSPKPRRGATLEEMTAHMQPSREVIDGDVAASYAKK